MTRDSYLAWHPHDHLDFKTIKNSVDTAGTGQEVYYKERIGRRVYKLYCVITKSIPGKYIEFKPTGLLEHVGLVPLNRAK